jgi:Subtilase family
MKKLLKKIQFLLFFMIPLLCFKGQLFSQGSANGYLYVYPSDPSAIPDQQGGVTNSALKTLLQQYQVTTYVKSFPGAQSTELQNAYEIHLNGNFGELKAALEDIGLFLLVEGETYMQTASTPVLDCPEPCSNPQSVNDPNSGYELSMPGYLCAWNITQGDPSVVIAVVDTDFDLDNPEFGGKIISKVGTPGNPKCNHHGNIVAGTIIAKPNNGDQVAGVAPGASVAGYVVTTSYNSYVDPNGNLVCSCSGNPWGQTWQAYLDGRRIINVSWNGFLASTTTLINAIKEMTENGTLLVLAAGNGDPGDQDHSAYYNIPGVLNVSSISSDGTLHEWVTYNQGVDLCAPGDGVRTINYDFCGSTNSSFSFGTSLAAPNAAGAAALILSVNPCLKPTEIENIIKTTTCPIIENPYPNWSGTGYLNAYAAVEKAKGFSGTLTQNTIWSGENYVSADVVVPTGISLTINGTTKFSEGAGLIIEPGGKVNLYGILTSSCIGPWNGLTVKGIKTESQHTAGKHGRLNTFAGSIIENATTGVRLWDGGVITAKETTIKNNGTGIEYCPYSNFWPFSTPLGWQGQPRNHFGGLTNCNFIINDDFKKAADINAFVQMNGVRGINITGCSFANKRSIKDPMGNDSYGYGIKATDSRFTVSSLAIGNTNPPTSFDHSDFYGLGYGIYVASAQTPINNNGTPNQIHDDFVNLPFTVQQASFTDCIYGIHNRFVSQGVIVGNTFNLGNLPPVSSLSGNDPYTNTQIGIFFENGANGFEMQENKFLGTDGNVKNTYGSYSQNLGWFNNDIRRNTYKNVRGGNIADEDNAILTPNRGLHYLCNTNVNKVFDFFVFGGADIRKNQGLEMPPVPPAQTPTFKSAGNSFTKLNSPDGDFSNGGLEVKYFHFGISEKPIFFSNLIFGNVEANACESDYCIPPCKTKTEIEKKKQEFATEQGKFNILNFDLQKAVNEGNLTLASEKEPEVSARRLNLDNLSNIIAVHLAYDSIAYNLDSVRVWWKNMDSPISEINLARDYFKHGNYEIAIAVLDELPSKFILSEAAISDLDDFRKIMKLMKDEFSQKFSEEKIEQLQYYAKVGKGISSAWAKNILTVQGYHFPPMPRNPELAGERSSDEKQWKSDIKTQIQFFC